MEMWNIPAIVQDKKKWKGLRKHISIMCPKTEKERRNGVRQTDKDANLDMKFEMSASAPVPLCTDSS